jgi:maltose alpha-D-glucosyltransferase/alpha-amylase
LGPVAAPQAAVPWRDPDSPLSWFQRMLERLRECAEVGVGEHEVIDVGLPQVLVHRAITRGSVLFAHDLADRPVTVRVPDIGAHAGQLVDPFHGQKYGAPELDGLELAGYGFRWIRLAERHCSVSRPASRRSS